MRDILCSRILDISTSNCSSLGWVSGINEVSWLSMMMLVVFLGGIESFNKP